MLLFKEALEKVNFWANGHLPKGGGGPSFLLASSLSILSAKKTDLLGNNFGTYFAGLKTVTNYFLLNLAVADIFITIFCTLNQVKIAIIHFCFLKKEKSNV